MSEPIVSGKEVALQIAERVVLESLLSGPGQAIPPVLARVLDFAPNGFSIPHGGMIAMAIRRAKNNGTAPKLADVLGWLEGDDVNAAQLMANGPNGLPLDLAVLEAGPLLRRMQHNMLTATLGEAWQESRDHPDQAVDIGRHTIVTVSRVIAEHPDSDLPPISDAATFVSKELPALPLLVDGLLHQGTKMVIGGGSKAFKTWLLMDLALSIAYGLPWLGFDCVRGRVLYVNLEIHEKFFQERLKILAAARSVELAPKTLDIWNLRGFAAPYQSIIPMMIERIKAEGYSANILDPIYKLYGKTDENSAGEVAQLLNTLETLCVQTGAATAFGAHYSKGNQAAKESIDRISGSGVFARDPDTIISFTKHEEEGCFVVEPILRNLPPITPFVVRWKYPLMLRDDDLDPAKLKQPANIGRKKDYDPIKVLKFIAGRTKENPISTSEWSDLSGIGRTTLNGYISDLREAGLIASIGEGSHARKYVTEKGAKLLQNSTDGN